MRATKPCPICKLDAQDIVIVHDYGQRTRLKCTRCGTFEITEIAAKEAANNELASKLSAWIRERTELGLDVPTLSSFTLKSVSLPDYSPLDKQLRFMRMLEKKSSYPGESISLLPHFDYPLAWANREEELLFYIRSLVEQGLLRHTDEQSRTADDMAENVEITTNGWRYLAEHARLSVFSDQAFVAMSFSEAMRPVWETGIRPAIERARYEAYRVDMDPHVDRIDAKIITEIKNSRFVVADVTEQKHGVYFEAGYALGINIPVIWSVKKDELPLVHFDTRQFYHIVWESIDDLAERLYYMISAVVSLGKKSEQ